MNVDTELNRILSSIKQTLPLLPQKAKLACFDADGTLWKEDVDMRFLQHQIKNRLLMNPAATEFIQQMVQNRFSSPQSHRQACSFLAQRNKGCSLDQWSSWCMDFFNTNPLNVFSFQKTLLSFFKENQVTVYVVSASPELLVQKAVQHYGLPVDHVIGVRTAVCDNKITDQLQPPLPIGPGKVDAFFKHSKKVCPFFVSGNTPSDLGLLEASTHFKMVVAGARRDEISYHAEQKLLSTARERAWFCMDLSA